MDSALEGAGYMLAEDTGVWARPGFAGIGYSDGDTAEEAIAAALDQVSDLSVLSEELRAHCKDWPSTYHLSTQRANLLRPLARHLQGRILEIGAGCGAITRYLGELGAAVLAVEGSPRRATIARARTRDLANVSVLAERFDDFKCAQQFDVVTLIGVLEYADAFSVAPMSQSGSYLDAYLAMLERARSFLKPGGLLIVAIENQLGLKYFVGAAEDHAGITMHGIEDRYQQGEVRTFGRKALGDLLATAGFPDATFLAPFPDYKLTKSVISEYGFDNPALDIAALASQSTAFDPQAPETSVFSPELVWPVVSRNAVALDMANSFLVVASKDGKKVLNPAELAWHYSTNRRPAYCKETTFLQTAKDTIDVVNKSLWSGSQKSDLLAHDLEPRALYIHGTTLSAWINDLVSRDGWSLQDATSAMLKYLSVVEQIVSQERPGEHVRIADGSTTLPGEYFDLMPHNIIVDQSGRHHKIDQEWAFRHEITAGYLLFRSLINLLTTITRLAHSPDLPVVTPRGFIEAIFSAIGWRLDERTLHEYVAFETGVRRDVFGGRACERELLGWLETTPLQRDNLFQKSKALANRVVELTTDLRERDKLLADGSARGEALAMELAERDKILTDALVRVEALGREVAERDYLLNERDRHLSERDNLLADALARVEYLSHACSNLHAQISLLHLSSSWRLTSPLRFIAHQMRRVRLLLQLTPGAVSQGGGAFQTAQKAVGVMRREGLGGVRARLVDLALQSKIVPQDGELQQVQITLPELRIVPLYVDPRIDSEPAMPPVGANTIGVHLVVADLSGLEEVASRLSKIAVRFDLYVSAPIGQDVSTIAALLRQRLTLADEVAVESGQLCDWPLAAMISQFGQRLAGYKMIGHFHSSGASASATQVSAETAVLDAVLGDECSTGQRISSFLSRLAEDANVIFADVSAKSALPPEQLMAEYRLVCQTFAPVAGSLPDYSGKFAFCENAMFWARTDALGDLLSLRFSGPVGLETLEYAQPVLHGALGRVAPAFFSHHGGVVLRVTQGDSIPDYRLYEEQRDFSASIIEDDIKVLAYYLPQFHPTPENDEWHGEGFTEWTKVRAANPLFEGHYQQHVPHPDLGYYLLDSPETLRKQAGLMRAGGVHGMIFYHYWFGGRMILEDPAQMLLGTPDIDMPFCFCWANENWTRRWDGNEKEILLGQSYSSEDARRFIQYLIPFFRDPRYIRIDNRPVLYVYRPSDLPDPKIYVDAWGEECLAAGLPAPFIVSVLTRGALDPAEFGMDAGVERVLHDWTAGAAPEIKGQLSQYAPINGTVLSYDDVAAHYSAQTEPKNFTYFRSLVPMWDNTPRYGSEAYVVHGGTPQRFQEWMETMIRYTRAHLPADRRFLVVNAWNEWAEGAHLEPDTRHGYAYLNAVGRSLAGISYTSQANAAHDIPAGLSIRVTFSQESRQQLRDHETLAGRFLHVLARSSILQRCKVAVDQDLVDMMLNLPVATAIDDDSDFVLEFGHLAIFAPDVIEKLVQTALANKGATVMANAYPGSDHLIEVLPNGAIRPEDAERLPMALRPVGRSANAGPVFRVRGDAICFHMRPDSITRGALPVVTTVVRVHPGADLTLLRNALSSLASMVDCSCIPLIAAQDISDATQRKIEAILDDIPWRTGVEPLIDRYSSKDGRGDLRSVMLNESFRKIKGTYAGILDYDDLLMPDAYSWLISRMQQTGKAVSFGRVYSTLYSNATGLFLERKKVFEYGFSYSDFIERNHAPVHSFLLDMLKVDMSQLAYHEDQKYMEDYYMLLQIFNGTNCDWRALSMQHYVGDYIHSVDREHTLALGDDAKRAELVRSSEYQRDLRRVMALQEQAAIAHDEAMRHDSRS